MPSALTKGFRVQGVVSDLFYTLVNPDPYRPEGFVRARKIAEVLGLAEADEFVQWWRKMEPERHTNGSKKVAQYADEYLLEHTGPRCTQAELAQVDQAWGHMYDMALLKPQDEVLSALRQLREGGVKPGLLSNIDEREAVNWKRSPLAALFDAACMSYEIGFSKPSKEAYSAVVSKLGVDASSSIYVGDGSHDELRGAREAGFGRVVFMKGFISQNDVRTVEMVKKREDETDATIMSLNELVALLD